MSVGALPILPPEVQFEHIRQLSLRNMGLNDDVGYFLRHFNGLNSLGLTDNRVTRLPEVLQQMKQLRRLYLANNQLQLTEYTRTKLGDLKGLTVLDLSNNPLAYRTGLVEHFHLPGQPRHMRYASLGGVTEHMLEVAQAQLKEAELSAQLLSYMVKLPFWSSHLRRTHAGSFDVLNQPFGERMEAVWAQRDILGDADYRKQMEQIQDEQKKAELTELERLTKEALQFDDMGTCELSPAG